LRFQAAVESEVISEDEEPVFVLEAVTENEE
jgi:hypothetical protein